MKTAALFLSLVAAVVSQSSAQLVSWDVPYAGDETVTAEAGSVLDFQFQGGIPHDVRSVPTQEEFDACDFARSTVICPTTNVRSICEVNVTEGTQYIVCTVGSHCASGGQKVKVVGTAVATTDAPSANVGNESSSAPTVMGTAAPVAGNNTGTPAPSAAEVNATAMPTVGTATLAPSVTVTSAPTGSPTVTAAVGLVGAAVGASPCLGQEVFATEEEALEASEFCNCTGIHSLGDNGFMIGRTHGQCTTGTIEIAPEGEVRMEVVDESTAALTGTISGLQPDCMNGALTINSGFSCNNVLGFDSPGETLFMTSYSTNSDGEATIDMEITAADLGFTGQRNIRYIVGLTLSMFGCGVEFPPTPMPTSAPSFAPTVNDTTGSPTISPTMNDTLAPSMSPTPNATMTMPPSGTDVNTTAPSSAPTVAVTNGTVTTSAPSASPSNSSESTSAPTVASSGNSSDVNATMRILQDNEDNSTSTSAPSASEGTNSSTSNETTTMAPTPMGSVMPTMDGNKTDGPMFYPRIACARFLPDAPELSGQTFGDVAPPGFPDAVVSTPFAVLMEMGDSSINGTANVNFKSIAESVFNYTLVFSPPVTEAPTSTPTNGTATSSPSATPVANTSAPTTASTSAPTNSSMNGTDVDSSDSRRVLAKGGVSGFMSVREGSCENLGAFFEISSGDETNGTFWMEAFPFALSADNTMVSDAQSLSQFSQAVLNQSDYEGLPVVASDESGDDIFACGILETPPLPRGIIYIYPAVSDSSRRLAKGNETETFNIIGQFSGLPDGSTVTIGDTKVTVQTDGDAQFFAPETVESTLADLMQEPFVVADSEGNAISEGEIGAGEITLSPTVSPTAADGTPAPTPTSGAPADNSLALGLGLGLGLGIPLLLALVAFTLKSGSGGDAKEPEKAYQGQQQTGGETAGTTTQQSSFTQGVQQA